MKARNMMDNTNTMMNDAVSDRDAEISMNVAMSGASKEEAT